LYFSVFTGLDERYEVGELKNPGTDNEIQSVKGQYIDRYRDEIGVQIIRTIGYVADENGFRPFVVSTDIYRVLSVHRGLLMLAAPMESLEYRLQHWEVW
jgi:hypothetical protein